MAKDRFKIRLECPNCGRDGIADAVEEDGYSYVFGNKGTTIDSLPDGFKIVNQPSKAGSVDIFCYGCDISAVK